MQRSGTSIKTIIADIGKKALPIRPMSSFHGGTLQRKPLVPTVTDITNKHKVVTQTTCNHPTCRDQNCADPHSLKKCPYTTPQQVQQQPPSGDSNAGFETKLVGNTTSKVPTGKLGFTIDPFVNYSGQSKPQAMVQEPVPITVSAQDLVVDPKLTKYVQEPSHYKTINDHINPT